ncbi:hypothetical protein ACVILK_002464 [Bradyrhizobium embrapense]
MTTQARPAAVPLAIPYHLYVGVRGKENLTTVARDTFTLSPALSTAMQQLSGLDWRGKLIIKPGDVAKAAHGDWRVAARAVAEEADFLGRGRVSLYSTLTNTINKSQSIAGGLQDQASISETQARLRSATRDNGLGDCKNRRSAGKDILGDLQNNQPLRDRS